MTTTRKIAHNTAIQLLGKVLSTFLGLLGIGLLTRYLGTEQYGWYTTALTFLQFVGILIDFGFVPVSAQMLAEKKYEERTLLSNLLGFRFVTALLFLVVTPFVALFFPYPLEVKIAIGFMTLQYLAIALNQVFTGYYQAQLRMHIQVMAEVLGRLALIAGLWLLISERAGFLPLMGVVTAAGVVYTVAMWIAARKDGVVRLGFDRLIWRDIWQRGWPIGLAILFNVIYLRGDLMLLSVFVSQSDVGLYGAAYRVIDVLSQIAMMIMGILLPLLTAAWISQDKETFRAQYQQAVDLMMLIGIPMLVGVLVLAEPIMRFIAGDDFAASGQILRILTIGMFGVLLGGIYGHLAVAIQKQKKSLWVYISNAIITTPGYFIFIPLFGLQGAAWMTVFSELYAGLMLMFLIAYYVKTAISLMTVSKIVVSTSIMAVVIMQLQHLHVLLLTLIGAVVYLLFLFILGAISRQTLNEIFRLRA